VIREILADTETPVSAFLKVADGDHAFLLESVESGERWSRYSILGTDPTSIYVARNGRAEITRGRTSGPAPKGRAIDDPLEELARWRRAQDPVELPGLPPFWGGAVGFLAYDAVRAFERLGSESKDDLHVPDAIFLLTDTVVVFDNLTLTLKVITSRPAGKKPDTTYDECLGEIERVVAKLSGPLGQRNGTRKRAGRGAFSSTFSRAGFKAAVGKAKEHIRAGDAVQIVLAQRFSKKLDCDPFDLYRSLRVINPSSYMFYLRLGDRHLVGSSPEVLVRLENGRVATRPIAGTRARGADRASDLLLEEELRADEKERAEHVMLVDLGRNDVGRVCRYGTVRVGELMSVERYSHVMHLVSNVEGEARQGVDAIEVLRACFPAGTVSGAPKIRAMEIIETLEPVRRGTYAGAVGYVSFDGNLDTCIAIRTAYCENGMVHVGSGAGIVADSDPEREYQETMSKARALFAAVESAELRAREREKTR
jgi:anthranilate synthase component 1